MIAGLLGRLVLNDGPAGQPASPPGPAAESLQRAMLGLLGTFGTADGRVDFRRLRASPEWTRAAAGAGALRGVDPATLGPRAARLAFWINVYNALVLHAVVALGVRRSVREVWGFFGRVAYRIGPHVLSLDAIEHGILRANGRRIFPPLRCFGPGDPRRALMLVPPDPRIHFAVTCGARSCPPVGVYRAEQVDAQLDLAARSFLNQEVELDSRGRLVCSRLLRWYRRDFDAAGGLRAVLLAHLDPGAARRAIERGAGPCDVYRPYDWGLQHRPAE